MGPAQKLGRRGVSAFNRMPAAHKGESPGGDPFIGQHLPEKLGAFPVVLALRQRAEERKLPVPVGIKRLHRIPQPPRKIREHGIHRQRIAHGVVNRHERTAPTRLFGEERLMHVMIAQKRSDSVHLAIHEIMEAMLFALEVHTPALEDEVKAPFLGFGLQQVRERGVERIVQIRDEQPERVEPARTQPHRGAVGFVAEFLSRLEHPGLGFLGSPGVGPTVENGGSGVYGNASQRRNVFKANFHGCAALYTQTRAADKNFFSKKSDHRVRPPTRQ